MGLNKFSLDNEVEIIFCDISDPEILNQCVELLKEIDQEIKIVIGGGDGTISRIVNSIVTNGIKLERVNFGCIPFGMNNQISECLGWGSHIHLS
jgi:diacylglycerol kinase family enzyme